MAVDNFGRTVENAPRPEDLLSSVRENKSSEDKRHEELIDLLNQMNSNFEKGFNESKKIADALINQTRSGGNRNQQEAPNFDSFNANLATMTSNMGNANRQIENNILQFARGGRGSPTGPSSRPAPNTGGGGGRGGGGAGGGGAGGGGGSPRGGGGSPRGGGGAAAIGGGIAGAIAATASRVWTGALGTEMGRWFSTFSPPEGLYRPLSEMLSLDRAIKDANQFDINMGRILYQTQGLTRESESFMKALEDVGNVMEQTGFDNAKMFKTMETYMKRGMHANKNLIKAAKEMHMIGKAQLGTERLLGLEANELVDHFADLNIQANMSAIEIGTVAKSMRDVALSTGLTGKHMSEAIAGSKQFNTNLMNAGNLTATSLKNITMMTANFKKFGADQAGQEIQSYLTDANKLVLDGSDKMSNLIRQAAGMGGVYAELQQGTIAKSEKSMQKFNIGFKKILKQQTGVSTLEEYEALNDAQRAQINLQMQAMYGKSAGEIFRASKAMEESAKTFEERLGDVEKQRKEGEGSMTAREKGDLDKKIRGMKVSRSLDIIGELGKIGTQKDVKTMDDVFGKFGAAREKQGFDASLSKILGVSPDRLKNISQQDIAYDTMTQAINDINAGLKEANKPLLNITPEKLKQAMEKGAAPEKMRTIIEELQEGQRRLSIAELEQQDPSTKALFSIDKNVHALTEELLKRLREGKDVLLGREGMRDSSGNIVAPPMDYIDRFVAEPSRVIRSEATSFMGNIGNMLPWLASTVTGTTPSGTTPSGTTPSGGAASGRTWYQWLTGGATAAAGAAPGLASSVGDFIAPNFGVLQGSMGTQAGTWSHWLAGAAERMGTGALLNAIPLARIPAVGMRGRAALGAGVAGAHGLYDYFFGSGTPSGAAPAPDAGIQNFAQPSSSPFSTGIDEEMRRILSSANPEDMRNRVEEAIQRQNAQMQFSRSGTRSNDMSNRGWYYGSDPATMRAVYGSSFDPNAIQTMQNDLFATSPRMQARMSEITDRKNQMNLVEEANSSEIVMILREIRDELRQNSKSGGNESGIKLLSNKSKMKVDSKLGKVTGGDYTKNDAIKAMNY